jgi:hypothetical protein
MKKYKFIRILRMKLKMNLFLILISSAKFFLILLNYENSILVIKKIAKKKLNQY